MHPTRRHLLAAAAAIAAAAVTGHASADPTVIVNPSSTLQSAGPAVLDFANARPMMPLAAAPASAVPDYHATLDTLMAPQPSAGATEGHPRRAAVGLATTLPASRYAEPASGDMAPQAYGTQAMHFTTSTSANSNANNTVTPLQRTGRLFFNTPTGTSWCSASMIRPGVLVTAAHCMNDGAGNWYSGWTYVPAYRNGNAPYGTFSNWVYGRISIDWLNGGGSVPNVRDFGILVFDRDARGNRIGDYTGWMGWWTNRLIGRHVTTVGYPGNMYGGEVQMRTDSLTYNYGTNNAWWGSDQRGGSSGSPVVVNLRNAYNNSVATPTENDANRVSGVISWGFIASAPMAQGASVFDSVFAQFMSDACSAYPTLAC